MTRPNKKKEIIIPQMGAAHLSAITASTVRGILFVNLEGTEFGPYILPLVNIQDWISKDITFASSHTSDKA